MFFMQVPSSLAEKSVAASIRPSRESRHELSTLTETYTPESVCQVYAQPELNSRYFPVTLLQWSPE